MKRKYETPSLPGTAIHRTAKVLKVDNIRTKQTPLMKLAMSSNKLFNSTSLPTTPEGRREGEDESEFNELSPRGASLSQAGRGGQWPQGASATITGGPRVHRSAQSIEGRGYLSGFFQTPCSPSTLFLIEERKTGSIRNNSDPSYAWVAGRRAGGVKYQEQAVGDFTAARMIGCLTLVLSSAGLSIHNGATDEVETVPGVGAFEVFGNRFVVMFSVRNFMVYLYEYSELESRLSLAVPPISTAGKVFCSFAWTASGRAFLSDDSARLYELTDGYTRIRCVASPLRPSILSAVASFIQTALTLPFGIGGAASRNRSPQMKLFCDDSRGLLYAFDAATTLVTVYSTSGSQGTVTQIGSGRCPGLDDDDIGAPAQAPAQALPRTVVMVAPVEATVSPFVNFVVVYASGIIDFFSVEEGGITLRYRRSAATLLRAATPIQGLSAVAHRIAAAVAEVSTNGIVVNDAVYNDGSFVFVVTAGSETLVLHSTSTDL